MNRWSGVCVWTGVCMLLACLVVAPLAATAETKSVAGVSVTIPDTWRFGLGMADTVVLHRRNNPERVVGVLMVFDAKGKSAREAAEEECERSRKDGWTCEAIRESSIGPRAPAVYLYTHGVRKGTGEEGTVLYYFARRSGTDTMISLSITAPRALFSERPGFLDEVDFIKDNLRF